MMKLRKEKWEKERDNLKEEKKKTEYVLFDVLKVSEAKKEKLQKIKQICGK
jgi:hypothetical protein